MRKLLIAIAVISFTAVPALAGHAKSSSWTTDGSSFSGAGSDDSATTFYRSHKR